ncbi:MAG: RNA polymerase sigma factor [Fimbriiglobus sp.]
MDSGDEDWIVRGLKAGQTDAWTQLYDQHAGRVWRVVARYLRSPEAVADVVQETFLMAAKSAKNYDPSRGCLWAWLWGIARTQTKNHLRREAKHANPRPREPDPSPSPLLLLLDHEQADCVRQTLLELPEDYERLLTAKYFLDESTTDIAFREKISEHACKSKLARAREAFRRAYPHADLLNEASHDTPG